MESRFLGFPCFPHSVISMACFGNAFHKVTMTARPVLGTGTTCPRWANDYTAMWLSTLAMTSHRQRQKDAQLLLNLLLKGAR